MKKNHIIEHPFLSGGGEMGKLIRAKDWSKTPLGDPETWPQSLRTMVSVLLDNPFGMYIAWGKEFTQIYNDGYRPILGTSKHPQALGISTKETFSEIWHIIGPMFEDVMNGIAVGFPDFMLPLDRHGYVETCYFDFAYSPIRMESGAVGGVLVTVIETTTKKKAQDDLKESKNELEFVIEAAQLGTFDYDPLSGKFSGNARLKEWFGLPSDADIELTHAIGVIVPKDKERVSNAIKEVLAYASGGNYDIEYTIINPDTNKETIVHARGRAWFNEDKIAYRLNGTLEDVTNRVSARKKIEESERSLRLMILQAPVAIAILRDTDYKVEIANKYALELWRRTEQEVLNIPLFDAMPELLSQGIKELLDNVAGTGNRFEASELPVQFFKAGMLETAYINFSYEALYDGAGKINGIMAIGYDVSPQVKSRKKVEESESRYHNLIHSSPSAIGILYGEDLVITIANEAILRIWGKGKEIIGKAYLEALPELAEQGYKEIFTGVYKTGIPFTAIETPVEILQEGEMTLKYYNFIVYPQRDLDGNVDGISIIATEVTSQAILNNKIKESEQGIRALVESAPFPIGVFVGEEMRISLANQSIMDAWGKGNDVVGKLYSDILPEFGNQQIFEQIRKVLHTGIPFHAKNQKVDIIKNGKLGVYYYNYSFTPLIDDSGNTYAVMNTAAEVTQLHEAKQKVEESERRFRDAVKQAPLGIAIFRGPEYITEMANENYLMIVDKSEAQFVGKPLFETLPEVKESIAPIIADIYKTGIAYYGYEFPINLNRHGKTEITYFNFVYHPLKENNEITGFMVVATEVTATVKAKHLIEENEGKLNLIIEASDLGVFDVNLESSKIVASDRYREMLGFPREMNLTSEDIIKNIHPEDVLKRKDAFEKAFLEGSFHYQIRVIWKDLSIHWIDTKGKVFYDESNKPVRMLGAVRDITEERNFQQQLLEREQKFRLLADSMPQFIWTADLEGNLNYFSQSVFDYSGLTREQLEKDGWLQIIHPDDRKENIRTWKNSITTGKSFLIEHRFRRYDGEYRWQLSRAIPQKDTDGNIQMWVGSSTDIQNIKEQEQQKDYFISMASHELKTPLTSIKGYVQILQTMYVEKEDSFLQKSLKTIDRQIITLTKLISELLDISKIKSGGLDLNLEHFEMTDLIQEVVAEIKHINPDYQISVTANEKAMVYADHGRIGQVLINFLTNAVKYAPQSKIIKVNCYIKNNNVIVSVQDFGIGISKNEQEKVFERFYRVEGRNEKTFPGFGIGLFISSEIIKKHQGKIGLKSELGKGSVFSFELPVN